MSNNFAATFKTYRTAANMTQRAVAEALGVSQTAVYFWESGRTIPGGDNLIKLERLFGCQQGDLLIAAVYPVSPGERG